MIELILTEECEGCECADLDVDCYKSALETVGCDVRCKHEEACARILKMMQRKETRNE